MYNHFVVHVPTQTDTCDHFVRLICVGPLEMPLSIQKLLVIFFEII